MLELPKEELPKEEDLHGQSAKAENVFVMNEAF